MLKQTFFKKETLRSKPLGTFWLTDNLQGSFTFKKLQCSDVNVYSSSQVPGKLEILLPLLFAVSESLSGSSTDLLFVKWMSRCPVLLKEPDYQAVVCGSCQGQGNLASSQPASQSDKHVLTRRGELQEGVTRLVLWEIQFKSCRRCRFIAVAWCQSDLLGCLVSCAVCLQPLFSSQLYWGFGLFFFFLVKVVGKSYYTSRA